MIPAELWSRIERAVRREVRAKAPDIVLGELTPEIDSVCYYVKDSREVLRIAVDSVVPALLRIKEAADGIDVAAKMARLANLGKKSRRDGADKAGPKGS